MTENDGTTATDLESGTPKPGGDYGDVSAADVAEGGDVAGGAGGRTGAGGTPEDDEATRAQEGVQAAFESGLEGSS
jgi:hypothetical protein